MSRIVVRREEMVQLLSITRDGCPLCGRSRDHVRVVEERPVFGEEDYQLPKLEVLETERSPRGAIDWTTAGGVGFWVCEEGIDPVWTSYRGWNEVRGRLYVIYHAVAKVAIVGNRLERGEGFYNPKWIQASQDRGWVLMADRPPVQVEPYTREVYHAACIAEAIMALQPPPEKIGSQGHLNVYRVAEGRYPSDSDGPSAQLCRQVPACRRTTVFGGGDNFFFLNHRVSAVSPEASAKAEVELTARLLTVENVAPVTVPEMPASQRSGKKYSFVEVDWQEMGWVTSSDHPDEAIQLAEGCYLFVHPVPTRDGDD